ncbi:MAG: response regulator [Balneolaceae bacterium]|nr:response regulator [Balneolaceae bacterium]MBO6544930.1 response regulator [Balneolaceae bacterium]MBO6646326.1 response regulator [Balneolaceae bacterium]
MIETKSRILVVDDYPALVTITRHKLLQHGYEVLTAQNGQDALELVETEFPDLVISDVEMPLMNGYELCKRIKESSKLRTIPVILVTSRIEAGSLMKGIEAGADNYLTKPYDDDTLFSKVSELLNNPIAVSDADETVTVTIEGAQYRVKADYSHLVNLLISTYKNTLGQNSRLEKMQSGLNAANRELELTKKEHEELLQNIFPKKIADSLLAYGTVTPERYEDATFLFTDFDGFSKVVPDLSPEALIESLSFYFDKFDEFMSQHNLIKIKTIGDSYMAAGGIPERNVTHPVDTALAALKMKFFVTNLKDSLLESIPYFPLRIGIHTGHSVVGVIGKKRFAYDVWGEAVNLASRMEQSSESNTVNISEDTYHRIKDFFECEPRGEIEAKNIGKVPMYFLNRIKPDLSEDEFGIIPNRLFIREYNFLSKGVSKG